MEKDEHPIFEAFGRANGAIIAATEQLASLEAKLYPVLKPMGGGESRATSFTRTLKDSKDPRKIEAMFDDIHEGISEILIGLTRLENDIRI